MVDLRDRSYFMFCLLPKSWNLSWRTNYESSSKDTGLSNKLRHCLLLGSSECLGYVFRHGDFLRIGK
ncbi:hypothetical protein BDV28DRAFT_137078 [Aspergillus coremiiformis]|uniref:Uncharacterized protein n=1 Tax=Aspergillus coremiiformis TaxID=138285 RepID=A0A5N6Z1W0_9EURO|nr:hypothetical protein BDV28DRAFT_137078 [Aspergillus coremiiformis]